MNAQPHFITPTPRALHSALSRLEFTQSTLDAAVRPGITGPLVDPEEIARLTQGRNKAFNHLRALIAAMASQNI